MNKFKSNVTKISAAALLGTFGLVAAQQVNSNITSNTVEAATEVGKINYKPGYSLAVRKSPSVGNNLTGQYLKHGTRWKIIRYTTDTNGVKWADLGKNDWVEAKYLVASSTALSSASTVPAVAKTSTQVQVYRDADKTIAAQTLNANTRWKVIRATVNTQGVTMYDLGNNDWVEASALTANNTLNIYSTSVKVVQVKTGYTASIYSNPNNPQLTGQKLTSGSKWKVIRAAQSVNGEVWYDLGNNDWVQSSYVSDVTSASQSSDRNVKIQAVINLAKQQLGKPYKWGGKGPSVFDCSGLMYYVFMNATGKNIGGWTVPQESAGRQVAVSQLQAGDLVFWGSHGTTYHVGLYLGNNQYIDAPNPGQSVQITSISSYFRPSFGVRVL